MKKLIIALALLTYGFSYSQITQDDFKQNYINVKTVMIFSNEIKNSYKKEMLQIDKVNVVYKENGISIGTNSGRQYFIPYKSIKWIEFFGDEDKLRLYLND